MIHPTEIDYDGSLSELVDEISNLRYDVLSNFFRMLAIKLDNDSLADINRKRVKLAKELSDASNSIRNAWLISEPFMPKNKS